MCIRDRDYAVSTNTDLYAYDVATGITQNLTAEMKGYDLNPCLLYTSPSPRDS